MSVNPFMIALLRSACLFLGGGGQSAGLGFGVACVSPSRLFLSVGSRVCPSHVCWALCSKSLQALHLTLAMYQAPGNMYANSKP